MEIVRADSDMFWSAMLLSLEPVTTGAESTLDQSVPANSEFIMSQKLKACIEYQDTFFSYQKETK